MFRAEVAQSVEHSPEKAGVDSSILSLGTTNHFPLQIDDRLAQDHPCTRMIAGLFHLGKVPEIERGDGYCRGNIQGFHVAAERDGKSSSGMRSNLG